MRKMKLFLRKITARLGHNGLLYNIEESGGERSVFQRAFPHEKIKGKDFRQKSYIDKHSVL
jgi:hypothetical protein